MRAGERVHPPLLSMWRAKEARLFPERIHTMSHFTYENVSNKILELIGDMDSLDAMYCIEEIHNYLQDQWKPFRLRAANRMAKGIKITKNHILEEYSVKNNGKCLPRLRALSAIQ